MNIRNLLFITALISVNVSAKDMPFYPRPVAIVEGVAANEAGNSRLRINLATNEADADTGISVGNVTVCTQSACYRPITSSKTISLHSTKEGKATKLVEFAIPREAIQGIYFENLAGVKTVAGDINIEKPLIFDLEYFGEDILVILEKKLVNNKTNYVPKIAAAYNFHPSIQTVYYNPAMPTVAQLAMSTTFSIPAGATAGPVVFSVAVLDVLNKFPFIDINPAMDLYKQATLSLPEIKSSTSSVTQSGEIGKASAPNSFVKNILKTGTVRIEGKAEVVDKLISDSAESSDMMAAAAAASTDNCAAFLSAKQQDISSCSYKDWIGIHSRMRRRRPLCSHNRQQYYPGTQCILGLSFFL